jgi:hypothetical protein
MMLPTSDARSRRPLPRRQIILPPTHSHSTTFPTSSFPPLPVAPSSPEAPSKPHDTHEHALDFATHSWDLAIGGLQTLTAKRELPVRTEWRTAGTLSNSVSSLSNYGFALVVLVCIVLMLIGGGVVLFVMLQL